MSLSESVGALAARAAQEIKAVRSEMAALPGGGGPQVFVQPTLPTVPPGTPYMCWQTGLGETGNDMTLWVEDGL